MRLISLKKSNIERGTLIREVLIVLLWMLGLVTGYFLSQKGTVYSVSLMRTLAQTRTSIVGLLLISLFPLVISAIALWLSKPWLILLLAFSKGLMYGFVASCVMVAFGASAWLVRWLVLFSDSVMCVCFLWLWLKEGSSDNINFHLMILVLISAVVCCFDYCTVSPFLLMLFDH